jgi:hypothetical protein
LTRTSRLYGRYKWVALVAFVAAVTYFIGGISGALPDYRRVVPILVVVFLVAAAKARRRAAAPSTSGNARQ